jgi:DNA phosphorothioation-associated putative methyltransferase
MADGKEFLFKIGKPEVVHHACITAPVGKLLPGDIYVHRSSENSLPAILRILIFAARQVVGEVEYNVIKMSTDGRKVSFLCYPTFDAVAHPALRSSVKVYLPNASYSIRDYNACENPPILHRKDQLVDQAYPNYEKFRRLTEQEDNLGLLSAPDIGYKQRWTELLAERNVFIDDHSVKAP